MRGVLLFDNCQHCVSAYACASSTINQRVLVMLSLGMCCAAVTSCRLPSCGRSRAMWTQRAWLFCQKTRRHSARWG